MHSTGYLTFTHVQALYKHGDSRALIDLAVRDDEPPAVSEDARRALRLLARLGDPAARAFCGPLTGDPGARCDAA